MTAPQSSVIRTHLLLAVFVLALMISASNAGAAEISLPADGVTPPVWSDFDRAVRLYTAGHYAEARDLLARIYSVKLTGGQNQLVRFLSGLTAFKLGRFEEVEKFFSGQGRVPPSLKDYTLYLQGQACFLAGQYLKARDLLGEFARRFPDSLQINQVRLTRAEALFYLGRPLKAFEECRVLAKKDRDGRVRLVMARIYESLDRRAEARSNYYLAMENSNTGAVRSEAAKKYKELLAPALDQPGREKEKQAMVRVLRREWRLSETLDLIDRLRSEGGKADFLGELNSEKAKTLFFSGQIKRAMAYYAGAARPDKAKKNPYGAWMYARSLKRLGRWEEAAKAFLVAAGAAKSRTRADQAFLEAGVIYLRLDKKTKAQESWSRISPYARSHRLKDKMLWRIGFYYYHKEAWDMAADRFLTLTRTCPKSKLARGAKYWLARSLEQGRHRAKARQHYRILAASPSEFYYRTLAGQRLGSGQALDHWFDWTAFQYLLRLEPAGLDYSFLPLRYHGAASAGRGVWAASDPGLSLGGLWTERARAMELTVIPLASDRLNRAILRIRDLAAAGAMDLAHDQAKYIRRLLESKNRKRLCARSWSKLSKADRLSLERNLKRLKVRLFALSSVFLAEIGDYRSFVKLQYKYFRLLVTGRSEQDKLKARRRFHPLAYPGPVFRAAEEFNLHPALILALIRTESYYNPDIISVANARGLMQILPTTGQKIAARLNRPPPHPEALFDPETNIYFGCWYLAGLIREFDGQLPLAVASYNAGPFNVKRWVGQIKGKVSLEEFIETIPFDQTRKYVKKVLGAFYMYRFLFCGKAPGLDLTSPVSKVFLNRIDF